MGSVVLENLNLDSFRRFINLYCSSMDDYLYCIDVPNDRYIVSPNAVSRFALPSNEFDDCLETHRLFVHPDDFDMLEADLNEMLQGKKDSHNLRYRWMSKEKEPVWINCRGRLIRDSEGNPQWMIGCVNEIGKKPMASNNSGLLAQDALQDLFQGFDDTEINGFIVRIGVDDFRDIIENKGSKYGDKVLKNLAKIIDSCLSDNMRSYVSGESDFLIDIFDTDDVNVAIKLYNEISAKVRKYVKVNKYEVYFTLSAGILYLDDLEDKSFHNMMKFSEFTLSKANELGKNQWYAFVYEDYEQFQRKLRLTKVLRSSINNSFKGYELYIQPIVDSADRTVRGGEALLRYDEETFGSVMPGEFISLLEESGLIVPVGRWVIRESIKICKAIRKFIPNFKIHVNLSYVQILKSDVLDDILEYLAQFEMPSNSLTIELTESGLLESNERMRKFCDGLKTYGIPFALDDFGTGYSNFRYINEMMPDTLKIDRTFITQALNNEKDFRVLRFMSEMLHSIDVKYVIEGIETEEELLRVRSLEPDYIQGYLFGKPVPVDDFLKTI